MSVANVPGRERMREYEYFKQLFIQIMCSNNLKLLFISKIR